MLALERAPEHALGREARLDIHVRPRHRCRTRSAVVTPERVESTLADWAGAAGVLGRAECPLLVSRAA